MECTWIELSEDVLHPKIAGLCKKSKFSRVPLWGNRGVPCKETQLIKQSSAKAKKFFFDTYGFTLISQKLGRENCFCTVFFEWTLAFIFHIREKRAYQNTYLPMYASDVRNDAQTALADEHF